MTDLNNRQPLTIPLVPDLGQTHTEFGKIKHVCDPLIIPEHGTAKV